MTAAELRQRLRRVGIWMPPPERAGIDPAKTAAAIEGAGFTSVWIGGGNATPDALDRLRPLLAGSENLIVATGIANVWAWEPARLRAAAAALAADFPDRFILGLGVSHEPAVTALGHPYQRPLRKMEKFLDELDHPAEHGADCDLPPLVQPELLREGRLVEVMQKWHFTVFNLWVVHVGNRYLTRPVRVFKEFAAQMAPMLFPSLPA